jgi:epoxide hydrolase
VLFQELEVMQQRRNFFKLGLWATMFLAHTPQGFSQTASKARPMEQTMIDIKPFTVAIPDADLSDLKQRLDNTRWPLPVTADWSHGQPLSLIKELAEQWRTRFDWRKHEAKLNALPQFTTEIDGQLIHFLHIRSGAANAFPLILSHGWPGSVMEFLDLIPLLTKPAAGDGLAFDLVIPSLPGFGFSSPLSQPGWDSARTAKAWNTLMQGLGYNRYGAHGGDVGSGIGRELGILKPEGLVGTHVLQIFAFPTGASGEMDKLTPFEMEGMATLQWFQKYSGYQDIQSKRPGTLAYALADSPSGQLAWNSELWFGFEGNYMQSVDRDKFLAHVSLYWLTNTAGSSANIYLEDSRSGAGYREVMNSAPTGVAVFPNDFRSVRSFSERANNIVHWSVMPKGGHFAASEVPDLLAADIRTFFGALV